MAEKRVVAFDLGTENGRAVVGTLNDGVLTTDELLNFKINVIKVGSRYKWDIYSVL